MAFYCSSKVIKRKRKRLYSILSPLPLKNIFSLSSFPLQLHRFSTFFSLSLSPFISLLSLFFSSSLAYLLLLKIRTDKIGDNMGRCWCFGLLGFMGRFVAGGPFFPGGGVGGHFVASDSGGHWRGFIGPWIWVEI